MLPWKREFWFDPAQNLMQPFPHPNDASDKIWLQSVCWFQRYSCLNVWTDGWTNAVSTPIQTYKPTLWAFSSGELKYLNGCKEGRTDRPKPICYQLFKVGGIIKNGSRWVRCHLRWVFDRITCTMTCSSNWLMAECKRLTWFVLTGLLDWTRLHNIALRKGSWLHAPRQQFPW